MLFCQSITIMLHGIINHDFHFSNFKPNYIINMFAYIIYNIQKL